MEGVRQYVNVRSSFKLVAAVRGNVELDMVSFQKRHFGLGVFFPKQKLLLSEVNPCTNSSR